VPREGARPVAIVPKIEGRLSAPLPSVVKPEMELPVSCFDNACLDGRAILEPGVFAPVVHIRDIRLSLSLKVSQIFKGCLDDLKLTIDSMEPIEADLLLLLATLRFRLEPRLEGSGIALRWEV